MAEPANPDDATRRLSRRHALAAGGLGLLALRSYPRDVATAQKSMKVLADEPRDEAPQPAP